MFWPERIRSIGPTDRVLEVGPGGTPHRRSNVFLEFLFRDDKEANEQRGHASALKTDRPLVYFGGGEFPFRDGAFDYVICSHVLEHVPSEGIEHFVSELTRVAHRGYVEFPTIYYEFLYNFPAHLQLLLYMGDGCTIRYLPKVQSGLGPAAPVQRFFYETALKGYFSLVDDLKPYMCQGFEWSNALRLERADNLNAVTMDLQGLNLPDAPPRQRPVRRTSLFSRVRRRIRRVVGGPPT